MKLPEVSSPVNSKACPAGAETCCRGAVVGASALLLLACEGKATAELSAAFSAGELRNITAAKDEEGQAAADGKGLALRLWIFRGRIDEVGSISGLGWERPGRALALSALSEGEDEAHPTLAGSTN